MHEGVEDLKEELGMLTDTLNEVLKRAEEALAALRYGVSATVPIGDRELVYKKSGKNWGLYVPDELGHGGKPVSVFSVSRKYRLLAAKAIPDLHQALQDALKEQIKDVRDAIEDLEPFVEELEKKPTASDDSQ